MFQTGKPGPRVTTCGGRCAHLMLSRNRIFGAVMAALGAMLALSQPAIGQCQYEVTAIIQAPPCWITGPPATHAVGLSEDGRVAGWYYQCGSNYTEAFVWTPNPDNGGGTFTTLPRPANVISAGASGVNSAGFVIGHHFEPGVGTRGFIYDPQTQEFKYLHALDPTITTTHSTLNAINENNVVAGSRRITPAGVQPVHSQAVIWYPYGVDGDGREVIVDLGDFGVGPNSGARAINAAGDVCGWTGPGGTSGAIPFRTDQLGNFALLDGTYGLDLGFAYGIDSGDTVVGAANFNGGTSRGFIWIGDKLILIDPLPGYTSAGASSVNNLGQVLGRSTAGANQTPMLWQNGKLSDLSEVTFQPPGSNISFQNTHAINDAGQILLRGVAGKLFGVVLAPINRPLVDLNADCMVNIHDLLMLLEQWGPCDGCAADFTGSGAVGVPDLLILLSQWGSS